MPDVTFIGYTQGGVEPCLLAMEGDNLPFPYDYGFVLHTNNAAVDFNALKNNLSANHIRGDFYSALLQEVQSHAIEVIHGN